MLVVVLMFLLDVAPSTQVDAGWLGGGVVGFGSLTAAIIAMWKKSESANRELIDGYKKRVEEAEERTKEMVTVLNKHIEIQQGFTSAMNMVAEGQRALAESIRVNAEAIVRLEKLAR